MKVIYINGKNHIPLFHKNNKVLDVVLLTREIWLLQILNPCRINLIWKRITADLCYADYVFVRS